MLELTVNDYVFYTEKLYNPQLFNLLLCRLIQTAVQTAADHGDPTQTSYGYFFYFGIPLRPPGSRLASEALQRRKALMKRLAQRDCGAYG